jgi:hypothetical protein
LDDRCITRHPPRPSPLARVDGDRQAAAVGNQAPGEPLGPTGAVLEAAAAWTLDGIDYVSDLAFAGGALFVLSDQSRRVVVVALPLPG